MTAVLEEYTTKEQSCVVHFLWAKGLSAKVIHKEMFPVYGGQCLWRKAVYNWVKKFSEGHSRVPDDAQQGRPVEIMTEATVPQTEEWKS
jgi:transposase